MFAGATAVVLLVLVWVLFQGSSARAGADVWQGAPGTVTDVRLADGSLVRLEPNAVLRAVATGDRSYTLTGTASFDVAPDAQHPFRVETEQVVVTVLGTRFTIEAEHPTTARVAVESGQVAVQRGGEQVLLAPHEQAVATAHAALAVRTVPTAADAVFAFQDAPFAAVLNEFELVFGVSVRFPQVLAETRITIVQHGPLNADALLEGICAPLHLQSRKTAEGYVVYPAP